jgi:hypothetical protein
VPVLSTPPLCHAKGSPELFNSSADTASAERKERQEVLTSPTILRCCGNAFIELVSNNYGGIYRHTRTTILLLLRVFFAAGTCLPNRCLPTEGGIHFTEAFCSNDRRDTHTDTQTDGKELRCTPL